MSEPLVEHLIGFTPDAGRLDRDSLLYAAGRASARPNRLWIALAAALAVSQVLTLSLWWLRPAPPVASVPAPPGPPSAPPAPPESPMPDSSESPGLWSAHQRLLRSELEDRPPPAGAGKLVDSGPPLRAFAPPPPSILN